MRSKLSALAAACLLTITGVWACLQTGLYFNRSVYLPAALWLLGTAGVVIVRLFCARLLKTSTGFILRQQPGTAAAAALYAAAGPAVIALLYALRLGASPLSMQATVDAVLRWSWLAVLAAALAWTAARQAGRLFLRAGWDLIGTVLAYTALAAVYGLLPLPHAVLRTADSGTAAFGARLGGLLQYPNTFGAIMAAFLVLQLLRLARPPQAAPPGWRLAVSAQALPYGLCLLLSESRGAWLAAAAAWTAAAVTARGETRGRLLAGTGWTLSGALILYRRLAQAELAPAALPGLAELAAAGTAVLLGPVLLHAAGRFITRDGRRGVLPSLAVFCSGRLFSSLFSALLIMAAAYVPLGDIEDRRALRTDSSTLSARWLMVQDGFKLFLEAPWWGRGGEVWNAAYRSVQSEPYVGSVMHSGMLDILLNLGLAGGLVWTGWLVRQGYKLARRRSDGFWPYLILVLHAAVDFDFSFFLYGLLLVWIIAQAEDGTEGEQRALQPKPLRPRISAAAAALNFGLLLFTNPAPLKRTISRSAAGLILAGCLFAAGLASWRLLMADDLFHKALTAPDEQAAAAELRRSLRLNPLHPAARILLADRLPRQEAVLQLRSGLRYSPRSPELYCRLAALSASGGELKAAGLWTEALQLDRFDRGKQLTALRSLNALAEHKRRLGLAAEAREAARAGLVLYVRYKELDRALSAGAGRNDRGFYLTEEAAEQAAALRGR